MVSDGGCSLLLIHKIRPKNWVRNIYSGYRLRINKAVTTVTFPLFQPPFQRISRTNDASFESPDIGRLEFAKRLAVASF